MAAASDRLGARVPGWQGYDPSLGARPLRAWCRVTWKMPCRRGCWRRFGKSDSIVIDLADGQLTFYPRRDSA